MPPCERASAAAVLPQLRGGCRLRGKVGWLGRRRGGGGGRWGWAAAARLGDGPGQGEDSGAQDGLDGGGHSLAFRQAARHLRRGRLRRVERPTRACQWQALSVRIRRLSCCVGRERQF